MPHLARYAERAAYSPFTITDPPQSEVSWTSIATGLNPGGHGMFDFVHRNPENYALHVSLLPTKTGFGGTRFAPPFQAKSIFDKVAADGYPATALWRPAMFPARLQSPVRTIPGLGTPDILGRLGVGTFYTNESTAGDGEHKTPTQLLQSLGRDSYQASFIGPASSKRGKTESVSVPFALQKIDSREALLKIGRKTIPLKLGEWSPIVELEFKIRWLFSVRAVTRVILTGVEPDIRLYALPLQIHPLKTPWHYGTPPKFIKQTWQKSGPFLTLGWPQDTTALEEGFISDEQFLQLCTQIVEERQRIFMRQLEDFNEGLLAAVFDTLDRVQHMFLKQRPDIVEAWYVKMDDIVGQVEESLQERQMARSTKLIILSDHGFGQFDHKVHLNRWLIDNGYLIAREGEPRGSFKQVDWTRTKAYAVGLNSIYLNLEGREGQGIVPEQGRLALIKELSQKLQDWRGPGEERIVRQALEREEAFDGPLTKYGPDLLVGYSRGFRASQQTGLGDWGAHSIEPNRDHWRADHCLHAATVPGVIFASHDLLQDFSHPSYRDIPAITIGAEPDQSGSQPPPPSSTAENEEAVEERLRSLGYL